MVLKKEDIINAISKMNVMEIVELVKEMEKKFDVSAASMMGSANVAVANTEQKEVKEQTEFAVTLESFGKSKISVIKSIRSIINLGLKEAKDFVESAPKLIKDGVDKKESEEIKKKLEEAGATVSIK
jgi:large subunit ribosomal protein L7/L12